ncbi:MAG: CpsD/CapB family tyrosine-protein kinase [Pirellulaceae bacterium]|nr:CpsD/CapB family tyrosine-protein kinase [Pirellulaceae bacterium]
MGHLLEALKQIENRAPAARPPRPATAESSASVAPSPRVASAPLVESSSPIESLASLEAAFEAIEEPRAAESVFMVLGEPCAVEDAFAVAERPIAAARMPASPLGESRAARAAHAGRDATMPVDPRYRELLGAILARMNVQGDTTLLVAGMAEDEPRGGQLAAFYPLLASRVDGGILVVDADERNAGATRLLGLNPRIALRDVLAGNASWQDAIRETRHPGLFVLPEVPDPTPLDPTDLSALIGVLRESHHLVIVDAVPSSPKAAARWSIVCDAAVLAIRLGVASRRRVRKTLDALAARGTDVVGCVLLEP